MAETEDKSINLLGELFDYQGVLDVFEDGSSAGFTPGAISGMFEILNGFAMTATALILAYLVSAAILQTAHDGEPLGKRFSTLWVPFRAFGAFVLVSPFPGLGGFSIIQAMIFALVGLSVGGANLLYSESLEYFKENNGTMMPIHISPLPPAEVAETVMRAEMCSEYVDDEIGAYKADSAYKKIKPDSSPIKINDFRTALGVFDTAVGYVPRDTYQMSWSGREGWLDIGEENIMCGEVTLDCGDAKESSLGAPLCNARGEGMLAFRKALVETGVIENIRKSNGDAITGKELAEAYKAYTEAWKGTVESSEYIQYNEEEGSWYYDPPSERKQALDDFVDQAQSEGWITAGQWYWTISAQSLEMQRFSDPEVNVTLFKPEKIPEYEETFTPMIGRLDAYMQAAPTPGGGGVRPRPLTPSTDEAEAGTELFSKSMAAAFGSGGDIGARLLMDGNDPIRSLTQFGHWMLAGSGAILTGYLVAGTVAVGLTNGFAGKGLGIGAGTKWGLDKIFSVLFALALGVITVGGFLAYYLPAIPFVFWMLAVLAWIVMVIQSLVAAPLWAVAHAVPEGDGFAGRHALQGWQLMVNVVFRPILLTLGLLLSMFLMHAIAYFAIQGFLVTSETIVASSGWGISAAFAWLFVNFMIAALIIVLAHKAHEIIYGTADDVMKWIGFGVSGLGSVQNEEKVASTFKQGAAGVKSAANAGIGMFAGGKGGGPRTNSGNGSNDSGGGGGSPQHAADGATDSPGKEPNPGGGKNPKG